MQTFLSRLTEPSSHAGIAALLQAAKLFAPQYGALIDGATMLFGALAVGLKEKGNA